MHTLYKMDSTGHGTVAEWNPEDTGAVAKGQAAFAELQSKGFTMFRMEDETKAHSRMDTFDPTATKVLAVPRLQGG